MKFDVPTHTMLNNLNGDGVKHIYDVVGLKPNSLLCCAR